MDRGLRVEYAHGDEHAARGNADARDTGAITVSFSIPFAVPVAFAISVADPGAERPADLPLQRECR